MNINKTTDPKFILLKINEEKLTSVLAPDFKTEILLVSKEKQNLILDLENLDYIDSAGLSCLLIANRLSNENNKIAVICNYNDKIEKLIKLTKLDSILILVNTVDEAKDYIMFNEIEKEL